ncbi:class I SAM-dependent methyltransferase [Propionicicella superfundia]|uniref:class I SAM-dependent methyltransferase n=1 Tax=Propionicicella superfundia TaxID=348582 RepID=UPI0003FA14CF|nr:class I SAM-dependent methyltransferase [Propionicicella superfundia]
MRRDERWNHNIHYHAVILGALPRNARTALDVGTGNELLATELHRRIPHVTGLDVDADVLALAHAEDPGVTWIRGDILTYPFPRASFDVVASVAALHHLADPATALRRFAELVRPGGVVAVVGMARSTRPVDWAHDVAGVVGHRVLSVGRTAWEHSAPTVRPPHSYAEVRAAARHALPGCRWRRLAMWRYVVLWNRPEG